LSESRIAAGFLRALEFAALDGRRHVIVLLAFDRVLWPQSA